MLCWLCLLLLMTTTQAQREGDYLQLYTCSGTTSSAELFARQHETLPGDGRNWTTVRPQRNSSLCVSACTECDPKTSGGYGRLQLQACQRGSPAQAWSLVPVRGGGGSVQVQTSKAFVQSQKCVAWNICPASTGSKRPFASNDSMIPYPGCTFTGPVWNEDMSFSGGLFRPASAEHNQAGVCVQAAPPPPPPPKPPGWAAIPLPSAAQLAWSRHEITAIGHFLPLCGVGDMQNASSWHSAGCGAPWHKNCLPAVEFDPKAVDTDGWVQAVKSMGAKVAVFVVRHGCGFDLWPTKAKLPNGFAYDYSIANSPFGKDGKADLARRFVSSCKKFNVTPGFYAAVANNAYLNVSGNKMAPGSQLTLAEYQQITLLQLEELWSQYGQIGEAWFDGGIPDSFKASILKLFTRLQPTAVMFQGPGRNAVRWAGTEGGVAPSDTWSTSASVTAYGAGDPNAGFFFPANCDTTLQEHDQWAYNPTAGLRSLKELIHVYHSTVGRNCNLELDWAPFEAGPQSGTLPSAQTQRFQEFGQWIRACYGDDNRAARTSGNTTGSNGTTRMVLNLPQWDPAYSKPIDRVSICEDQAFGQRILEWRVITSSGSVVGQGQSIGNKRIALFNATTSAKQLVLEVTAAKAQPVIRSFSAFYACPDGAGQVAAKTDDDSSALAAPARWKQDVFAISEWQPPFVSAGPDWEHEADVRYSEFANANFTVLLGGLNQNETTCYCSTGKELCCGKTSVAVQMKLCEKHGLKCVPGPKEGGGVIERIDPTATSSKAWWGFDIKDEPSAREFPMLKNVSDQVAVLYPGHLRFINLLPNYANPAQYNASDYVEYVDTFVREVQPDVLCMDHYPFFELADDQSCESRAGYRANLGVLRAAALKAQIPFWNFFSSMPFGGHSDPTEAQLAWQIFTSLAFGAKGVLYFCYWSPAGQGATFVRGGGVIYPQGTLNRTSGPPGDISLHSAKLYRRGAHYGHARKINSIVKNWGRYLLRATSTGVYRLFPGKAAPKPSSCNSGDQPPSSLDGSCVLNNVTDLEVSSAKWTPKLGEGVLIGQFSLDDGRTALLLQNQNFDFNIWPTIGFVDSVKLTDVLEVDPVTGAETALLDDSPLMQGWQISIQAGYARLLIVPAKPMPRPQSSGIV